MVRYYSSRKKQDTKTIEKCRSHSEGELIIQEFESYGACVSTTIVIRLSSGATYLLTDFQYNSRVTTKLNRLEIVNITRKDDAVRSQCTREIPDFPISCSIDFFNLCCELPHVLQQSFQDG